MKVIDDLNDIRLHNTAVTIGNFDGVHLGHKKLIDVLVKVSAKNNMKKVVFTFKDHTLKTLQPCKRPCLLTQYEDKLDILGKSGVDFIISLDFTDEFSRMSYEDFVHKVLIEKLDCKELIVGEDFTFGYKGLGNTVVLSKLCNRFNINLKVVPHYKKFGNIVSSTFIRDLIANGYLDVVKNYLGRNFSFTGHVISGNHIGRTIEYPTINMEYDHNLCLPEKGVYVTNTEVLGKKHLSITNIGTKPTVKNDNEITIESYLLNFHDNIYGTKVRTEFLKRIRNEKKFNNLNELKRQLGIDVIFARNYYNMFYKD